MTSEETSRLVQNAAGVLRGGGVVALPTDTLYALAVLATDDAAVARAYRIKGREDGKPMPLFVAGIEMAERVAVVNDAARRLAGCFWPGALTLVLPRRPGFHSDALAGGDTVALRVPEHPLVIAVLQAVDGPLTGTSANRSGGPDPSSAVEVERQLDGEVDLIIDGGECALGVSSTIVDCTGDELRVLRPGAIGESAIREALQP